MLEGFSQREVTEKIVVKLEIVHEILSNIKKREGKKDWKKECGFRELLDNIQWFNVVLTAALERQEQDYCQTGAETSM